jgi:hypothetical protein
MGNGTFIIIICNIWLVVCVVWEEKLAKSEQHSFLCLFAVTDTFTKMFARQSETLTLS